MIRLNQGLELGIDPRTLEFQFGGDVRGPKAEFRTLDEIRPSLLDPNCNGPTPVYSIVMDVHRAADEADLRARCLLFGVVAYAAGRLGEEPVRSQGHVHTVAPHSGWSPPELFEIWEGRAIIYAQERTTDNPGCCIAVTAGPGDKVVVPPGWAHAVINADTEQPMIFGAWCDRQYGFDYTGLRAHAGLAYFPLIQADRTIRWTPNDRYQVAGLTERASREYSELDLDPMAPIYLQYQRNPETVEWVAQPQRFANLWPGFEP